MVPSTFEAFTPMCQEDAKTKMFDVSVLLLIFVFVPIVSTAMTTTAQKSMLTSSASLAAAGRVELFFKNPSELKDRIRFLRSSGIDSFNLVNKNKKDDMVAWIDWIREVYPEADISAHYSLKHNKVPRKGIQEHTELLLENLRHSKADEILMVSGSGEKKAWNAVEALKAIATSTADRTSHPKIAVAYNPYFPSCHDQAEEKRRLIQKLETGCVSKVYLQFGTDMDCLRQGLEFIRKHKDSDVAIAGSLFLPTKKLIAQQKFRPWNGVFLSPDFLKGPEEATAIVLEMIRVYKANDVEMLWEAPGIRTEKDMGIVKELIAAAKVDPPSKRRVDNDNLNDLKSTSPKRSPKGEITVCEKSVASDTKRRKQSNFKRNGTSTRRLRA